jgi:RNA polymerase sigma-70 factor (ECF subfamily)
LEEAALAAVEDPADDPELAIRKRDRDEILSRCLTVLSREQREVIDLRH